jgi:hypothetical protein
MSAVCLLYACRKRRRKEMTLSLAMMKRQLHGARKQGALTAVKQQQQQQ